jgi:cardiolipin synthase
MGSSNFDYLSYRLYQEIMGIITSAEVISRFKKKVIRIDLNNSTRFEGHVGTLDGYLHDFILKSLADLSIFANKIC